MRTSMRQLAYDLADVLTDILEPKDRPEEPANDELFTNAKVASDMYPDEAPQKWDTPGPATLERDFMGEERGHINRLRALELACGAAESAPTAIPVAQVLATAAQFLDFLRPDPVIQRSANLGYATNAQLIKELSVRYELGHAWPDYRTVD